MPQGFRQNAEEGMLLRPAATRSRNSILHGFEADISESAVRVLNEKYVGEKRLKFLKMDACEMTFNEKSFDVSIDKGTLDALLTGVNDDVSLEQLKQQHPEVLKILNEIYRVTSNVFFLISQTESQQERRPHVEGIYITHVDVLGMRRLKFAIGEEFHGP